MNMKKLFLLTAAALLLALAACEGAFTDPGVGTENDGIGDYASSVYGLGGPGSSGSGGRFWAGAADVTSIFGAVELVNLGKYPRAVAFGNGTFVAGGTSGKMAYSTDGKTWTAISDSTFGTNSIDAIAYGNNKFVAVGDDGKMATSTDGKTWTAVSDSKFGTTDINAIAWGNGTFVAGGDDGKMATSSNGTSWTAVSGSPLGTIVINAIAWGNGTFVAGSSTGKMAYSSDNGASWTESYSRPHSSQSIAITWGKDKFVAVDHARAVYSSNGTSWTAGDTNLLRGDGNGSGHIQAIAYGNNKFIAVGGGSWFSTVQSSDGITWTGVKDDNVITDFVSGIYSIAFGNGIFVAGAYNKDKSLLLYSAK
jgi:hypothetical protein